MSRSIKKTKIFGNVSSSEKKDKRINNRMFRRREHTIDTKIKKEVAEEYYLNFIESELSDTDYPIDMNEVRSIWAMSKDGKNYWEDATNKEMRK